MNMRLGLGFDGMESFGDLVEYAKIADLMGFDSIWTTENYYYRDGFTPATVIVMSTNRIRVAVGTISPYVRHPVITAITILGLQRLSGGRMILQCGVGVPEAIERFSNRVTKPLAHIRESTAIIRDLMEGKTVEFSGEVFSLKKYHLRREALVRPAPIYLAAIGPKMLQLAGAVADGILLPAGISPQFVKHAVENIRAGAEASKRKLSDIDVCGLIIAAIGEQKEASKEVKKLIAWHFSSELYSTIAEETNLRVDRLGIVNAFKQRDWNLLDNLITDEMLNAFSVVGSPDECMKKIEKYREAGLDLCVVFPLGDRTARMETIRSCDKMLKEN